MSQRDCIKPRTDEPFTGIVVSTFATLAQRWRGYKEPFTQWNPICSQCTVLHPPLRVLRFRNKSRHFICSRDPSFGCKLWTTKSAKKGNTDQEMFKVHCTQMARLSQICHNSSDQKRYSVLVLSINRRGQCRSFQLFTWNEQLSRFSIRLTVTSLAPPSYTGQPLSPTTT